MASSFTSARLKIGTKRADKFCFCEDIDFLWASFVTSWANIPNFGHIFLSFFSFWGFRRNWTRHLVSGWTEQSGTDTGRAASTELPESFLFLQHQIPTKRKTGICWKAQNTAHSHRNLTAFRFCNWCCTTIFAAIFRIIEAAVFREESWAKRTPSAMTKWTPSPSVFSNTKRRNSVKLSGR